MTRRLTCRLARCVMHLVRGTTHRILRLVECTLTRTAEHSVLAVRLRDHEASCHADRQCHRASRNRILPQRLLDAMLRLTGAVPCLPGEAAHAIARIVNRFTNPL